MPRPKTPKTKLDELRIPDAPPEVTADLMEAAGLHPDDTGDEMDEDVFLATAAGGAAERTVPLAKVQKLGALDDEAVRHNETNRQQRAQRVKGAKGVGWNSTDPGEIFDNACAAISRDVIIATVFRDSTNEQWDVRCGQFANGFALKEYILQTCHGRRDSCGYRVHLKNVARNEYISKIGRIQLPSTLDDPLTSQGLGATPMNQPPHGGYPPHPPPGYPTGWYPPAPQGYGAPPGYPPAPPQGYGAPPGYPPPPPPYGGQGGAPYQAAPVITPPPAQAQAPQAVGGAPATAQPQPAAPVYQAPAAPAGSSPRELELERTIREQGMMLSRALGAIDEFKSMIATQAYARDQQPPPPPPAAATAPAPAHAEHQPAPHYPPHAPPPGYPNPYGQIPPGWGGPGVGAPPPQLSPVHDASGRFLRWVEGPPPVAPPPPAAAAPPAVQAPPTQVAAPVEAAAGFDLAGIVGQVAELKRTAKTLESLFGGGAAANPVADEPDEPEPPPPPDDPRKVQVLQVPGMASSARPMYFVTDKKDNADWQATAVANLPNLLESPVVGRFVDVIGRAISQRPIQVDPRAVGVGQAPRAQLPQQQVHEHPRQHPHEQPPPAPPPAPAQPTFSPRLDVFPGFK